MSKKQHQRQLERARARRRADAAQRRSSRNRVVVVAIAVLVVAALVALPLLGLFSGDDPEPTPSEPTTPSEPALQWDEPFELTIDPDQTYRATISTSLGDLTVELDPVGAPVATNNFVNLAEAGFYDGVIFHRVIQDFMIQGGDPTGTGSGGPGYRFDDELDTAQALVDERGGYPRGTLAMANAGANTNGSQFFIIHAAAPYPLDPDFTVFGELVDGFDVLDAIATSPVDVRNRPTSDIAISTVTVEAG